MAARETELFCIGNALVDVFARGEEQIALRYGINGPVQHIEIETLHELLGALNVPAALPALTAVSGGGAANVAKIASYLGADLRFAGALGRDEETGASRPDKFGRLFERDLSEAGVKLRLALKPSPTGICLMLQTAENETRIAASPSASVELSESDIDGDEINKAKIVVIDGFMLGRPGLVRHILGLVDKRRTLAAIDLSSAEIAGEYAADILDYARQYSLFLFMNEEEAGALLKALAFCKGPDDPGLASGLLRLLSETLSPRPAGKLRLALRAFVRGIRGKFKEPGPRPLFPVIVVKLGPRGAAVFSGGNVCMAETQALSSTDSTGAGDAFCAGFLTAWLRKKPLAECAAFGNRTARLVLDVSGTKVDGERFKELRLLLR